MVAYCIGLQLKSKNSDCRSNQKIMATVTSFPPICSPSANVLILGSMPGVRSLAANEYYAHPRNAFWPIMSRLLGFDAALPYAIRVEKLSASGIALWDVLHSCMRPGSLDSAIERDSKVANDFSGLFATHPQLRLVAFNGTEAEKSFKTHVLPQLKASDIAFVRLPSTSPAHTMPLEQKLALWREALGR
jgi:double-stranded uracil-DNA glycosylase